MKKKEMEFEVEVEIPMHKKGKCKRCGHETMAQRDKVAKVMDEYKEGKLPIGLSKKKVKSRKQAVAIAMSEAGIKRKKKKKK